MPSNNPNGRKPKLTREIVQTIHDVLANGNTIRTACQAVRVSEGSFFGWLQRGEENDRSNKGLYVELLEKVNEAKAVAKITGVGEIKKAGATDWRAWAWLLERTYGEEYGNRQTHAVTAGAMETPGGVLNPAVPFAVNLTISPPRNKEEPHGQ